MNEKQYLLELEKQLTKLNRKERNDILRDFEEYFENGRQEGKSDEGIIQGLGEVAVLAEELLQAYSSEDFVEEVQMEVREAATAYKNIDVNIDGANLTIYPTDRTEAYIEVKDQDEHTEVDMHVVADTLYVKVKHRGTAKKFFFITFVGNLSRADVKLYLPKVNYEQIKVYNDDGFIHIEETYATAFELESDNGRIVTEKLVGQRVNLETDNGRIEMRHLVFKEVKAKTDNGRIIAEKITSMKNQLYTDNGRIELTDMSGTIEAETDNGRIVAQIESIIGTSTFKTDNGSIQISSPSRLKDIVIEANTSWGSTTIYGESTAIYTNGSMQNKLKLKTSNGKILVMEGSLVEI
jgi:DUF4097 and DUF4098 domain-containing protein YvlB